MLLILFLDISSINRQISEPVDFIYYNLSEAIFTDFMKLAKLTISVG